MLTKDQLKHLDEEGYLVVENLLDSKNDLDPILEELSQIADQLANDLLAKTEISSSYRDLPFGRRLIRIVEETGQSHSQHFDFSLPKGQVGAHAPMYLGSALFRLITNDVLLDCIQDIIGPEIYSNPVQHTRL
jgi:phytanoyl-CoA hydroxylase